MGNNFVDGFYGQTNAKQKDRWEATAKK